MNSSLARWVLDASQNDRIGIVLRGGFGQGLNNWGSDSKQHRDSHEGFDWQRLAASFPIPQTHLEGLEAHPRFFRQTLLIWQPL